MSRRALGLFLLVGVVWGIPYLLIAIAVRQVTPEVLVFCRTAIGGLLLLPVAAVRRELAPLRSHWRALLAYTVVELAIPWVLLSTAEERLPSSLTGLLVAAVPVAGAVLAAATGAGIPLGRRGMAGLGVGLAGVAVLVGLDVHGAQVGSTALLLVVVVGYAAGPALVARRLSDVPPVGLAASSLLLCAAGYAPFALTELPRRVSPGAVWSLVVLGVVCTAVAFVAFFGLIAEVGPVRATVVTYLNPAVAVVLGAAANGEHVGWSTAAGFALILAGSWLATHRGSPAPGGGLAERAAARPA